MNISRTRILILLALALFTLITGLIAVYRGMGGSNDFDTYYVAGKSVLEGWSLYDGRIAIPYSGSRGPFLYPPFAACAFMPLALIPFPAAPFIWNALNILFFLWSLVFCRELFLHAGRGSLPRLSRKEILPVVLIGAGLLLDNIVMTQVNLLVFFLLTGSLLLRIRGRARLAGFITGLACFFKLTPFAFVLFYGMKRDRKACEGILAGILTAAVIIPALLLGPRTSVEQHTIWAERMLKPVWTAQKASSEVHLLKPHPGTGVSSEELVQIRHNERERKTHLDAQLNPRNQALSAVLTRYLLKDRNRYAMSEWYPVWGARRYLWLPEIGGIDENHLLALLKGLSVTLLLLFAAACYRRKGDTGDRNWLADAALTFLVMTLLSPIARTHQFVGLFFAVSWIAIFADKSKIAWLWSAATLYVLCLFRPFQAAGAAGLLNAGLFLFFLSVGRLPDRAKQIRQTNGAGQQA